MADLGFIMRALLEALPYIYIMFLPFKRKTRLSFGTCVALSTAVMMILSFVITAADAYGDLPHRAVLAARVGQLAVLLGLTISLVKDDLFKVFYIFFAVFPYMSCVSAISRYIAQYVSLDYNIQYIALLIIQTIVSLAMFYPVLKLWNFLIVEPLGGEKEDFWKSTFAVPLTISLVTLLSMENGGVTIEISLLKLLERVMLFGCVLACSYSTVHIREQISKQAALKEQSDRDRLLLSVQKEQYDVLAEYIENTRAARHDFKHNIIALKRMCEEKNFEQMQKFLDDADVHTNQEPIVTVSANKMTNIIFDHYLKKAKAADITVKLDMRVSKSYGISDSDLCVLFGNILENAIEACSTVSPEKRFIRIGSSEHAGRLFLTFDNSFDGKYVPDENNIALSRKRNFSRSGVGLQSIRAIIEKYGGDMQIETKENVFCLSVMLIKVD